MTCRFQCGTIVSSNTLTSLKSFNDLIKTLHNIEQVPSWISSDVRNVSKIIVTRLMLLGLHLPSIQCDKKINSISIYWLLTGPNLRTRSVLLSTYNDAIHVTSLKNDRYHNHLESFSILSMKNIENTLNFVIQSLR